MPPIEHRKMGSPRLLELLARIGLDRALISTLLTRGAGVLAAFAVTFLIGHNLGAAAMGRYALVMQTASLLAVAGLVGLDVGVVRHLAKAVAERKRIALSLLGRILLLGLAMLMAISALLAVGKDVVWSLLFGEHITQGWLLVLCILILGRGFTQLVSGLLRSQHHFTLAMAVWTLFMPGFTALALAFGLASSVGGALWAGTIGAGAAIVSGLAVLIVSRESSSAQLNIPIKAILVTSLPLWLSGFLLVLGDWYGLMVAARVLGPADAGLFRVSVQIASVLMIVSSTIFSVYSARISAAFHAQDRDGAAHLARSAAISSAILATPLAILIWLGGSFLLGQIGPEFGRAFPVLAVITTTQLFIALTGPSGLVLAMSGHEKLNLLIVALGSLASLVIAPLAAMAGGLVGLALAVGIALIAQNLSAALTVRRRLGIDILRGKAIGTARSKL